jgi:hypothetical protein
MLESKALGVASPQGDDLEQVEAAGPIADDDWVTDRIAKNRDGRNPFPAIATIR